MGETRPSQSPGYDVIYADPPWRFKPLFKSATYSNNQENHYPTMPLEDLLALSIPAKTNSVLYLWTTSPHLQQSFRVVDAWGFTYKASAIWVKPSPGTGYWWRNQHEILLCATRGRWPSPAPKEREPSLYALPRLRHSQKPAVIRQQIERWWPSARRLEMFARSPQPGWHVWGNEVESDVEIGVA